MQPYTRSAVQAQLAAAGPVCTAFMLLHSAQYPSVCWLTMRCLHPCSKGAALQLWSHLQHAKMVVLQGSRPAETPLRPGYEDIDIIPEDEVPDLMVPSAAGAPAQQQVCRSHAVKLWPSAAPAD